MRVLHAVGNGVLTVVALIGVLSILVWGATAAGFIQPLIVISGSMEPEIMTGDLLVATPVPVEDLAAGDVVSLDSEVTGDIITHRIIEVLPAGAGAYDVRMQGDANDVPDGETYRVVGEVWSPAWQISGGGYVVRGITRPQFAVPALIAVLAGIGLTMLPKPARTETPDAGTEPDPGSAAEQSIDDPEEAVTDRS